MKEGIDEAKIKETNAKGLSLSFYYSDSLWNGHKKIQKKKIRNLRKYTHSAQYEISHPVINYYLRS